MLKTMTLKEARRYYGYTLRDVAEHLRIPVVEYWIYEQEPGEIPMLDAMRVCKLFGCTIDEILLGTGED